MKDNSRQGGFPEFFADAQSTESVRRQFLEAPLEAARQSAFGPAFELAQLLSLLPDVFVASQRRELERVRATSKEYDPRIAALESSIEEAETLRTMARRGEVRAQRSLVALANNNRVFHGFVSDSELNPLEGLTVRLKRSKDTDSKEFSDITDDAGYFSIELGRKTYTSRESDKEGGANAADRIAQILSRKEGEKGVYQQQSDGREGIRVDILKENKIVYEDPVPIELNEGSAYREYVISGRKPASVSDFQQFVSQQGKDQPNPKAELKKDAAKASRPRVSATQTASSATTRRAKKKSSRGAKPSKSTNKK